MSLIKLIFLVPVLIIAAMEDFWNPHTTWMNKKKHEKPRRDHQ